MSILWYMDASFAVHKYMKSHTVAVINMRSGAVILLFTKQKVNARSLTEAELVAVNVIMAKISGPRS